MKPHLLAGVALLYAVSAGAQAPRFSPERLSADDKTLSSDAFEGRAPGTRAEAKTIAWIADGMKAAGLRPAGDVGPSGERRWTQDVPLLQSDIVGAPRVSVTLGGGGGDGGAPRPLAQGQDIAIRAALNGEHHVTLDRVPIVFVGYGVAAPEQKWDDFKGMDVRGKAIVVLVNDPDFEGGEGDFGGKRETYYGRWTYKYEEGARRGAKAVLIVHETAPASYGWATVKNSNTTTMFDIVRPDPARAHVPMEAWIQHDAAVDLFKASGLDFEALKRQARTRAFQPVALKATLSADYAVDARTITTHNVAGRLPGTRHPDETVIYSAHWDHFGIGAPDAKGDRIYNGAIDNATGVASILELARAFAAAPRTDRSVVFLAVTAEERGLLGSEYYAANPLYPLATTAGVINIDALNPYGPARNFTISGSAKLGLLDDLVAEGARRSRAFTPDPHPEAGSFFRSDHFPLAKRGVPAISFESGNDLVTGGTARGEALGTAYVRDDYHQPSDEWRPDFDFTGIAADLDMLYTIGRKLAESRAWPAWSADSEFKAARDATAGARKP